MTEFQKRIAGYAVKYITEFIGLPYIWGGDDTIKGFDCSGLAIEMLKMAGLVRENFDTTANGLWRSYQDFIIDKPMQGALVFFGTPEKVAHVGICIDEYSMIEAGGGGSRVHDAEDAAKYNAYIRVRPITSRRDFVGLVYPFSLIKGGSS
jgi:cell wall-associated NlpC family hydrolase